MATPITVSKKPEVFVALIIAFISLGLVISTPISTELAASCHIALPESGVANIESANIQNSTMLYPIVFSESGLAKETIWSVTITNLATGKTITNMSNGDMIYFFLPNGTYPAYKYQLSAVTGYAIVSGASAASNGTFGVYGGAPDGLNPLLGIHFQFYSLTAIRQGYEHILTELILLLTFIFASALLLVHLGFRTDKKTTKSYIHTKSKR